MAEHPSPILTRPAGRGWSRWLAALLFGLLLLLTLLIASWFLRACAPVDPSTNLDAPSKRPRRRRPNRRPIRRRC